jgi:tetratricopeptide (TPR) repeat protein
MAESATLPGASRRLWILGPWQDWLLFIGTPALILPLVFLARTRVRLEDMALFVAAFGALGHHFPGMLRAYGDRELFERFRVRFIVAPLFLVAVCVFCVSQELSGLTLILYAWGVWHGLAQTYGFLRIYDAKVQSSARLTCRLDLAMCVAWFGGGVLLSPTRMHRVLEMFYASGGPVLPAAWVQGARVAAEVALVGVTLAFLAHLLFAWRGGQKPSPLKLLTMLTSFGFWWYSNVAVSNLLLGILLFELFHDVQYLSIVWAFNRNRAEKGALSGLSRFLFRPRAALIAAYVGLVFAYGTLSYAANGMPDALPKKVLMGVLAASALLHFYFDGFIWKVRDRSTRQSLGLAGGQEGLAAVGIPGWLTHSSKWLLFLAPLAVLGVAQARGVAPEIERTRSLAQVSGRSEDQLALGLAQLAAGEGAAAAESFRAVLAEEPASGPALVGLGDALFSLGQHEPAEAAYRSALETSAGGGGHNGLGNLLALRGQQEAALAEYRRALELAPELFTARANLGGALASLGQWDEALLHQRKLVEQCADCSDAGTLRRSLAETLAASGRPDEALEVLREAVLLAPGEAEGHYQLADLLAAGGQYAEAARHYEAVLQLLPGHAEAHFGLGNMQALLGHPEEAQASYRAALASRPEFPEAFLNLGIVLLNLDQLKEAEESLRAVLRLDPRSESAHLQLAVLLRRRGQADEAARHEAAGRGVAGLR